MRRVLRISLRVATTLVASRAARRLCCLIIATLVLYMAWPGWRSLSTGAPFSGDRWYNPYERSDENVGPWLKASFHSHGRAWLGLSDGEHSDQELFANYRRRNFDIVGISNYQRIRPPFPGEDLYFECYEHGFGLGGQHQTVIGNKSVRWLDAPLFQTLRHKQWIIDELRAGAELVIVNHPNRKNSYTLDDMKSLRGYHGVEIRTRFAKGIDHWDAALSSGNPVWGFCADDCHSVTRGHIGNGWILVHARERSREAVLAAVKRGEFVNVRAMNRLAVNGLESLEVNDGVLTVQLKRVADMIRFVGQGGKILHWVSRAGRAEYEISEDDSYVRIELNTRGTFLYLNPIFRHAGDPFAAHFAPAGSSAGTATVRVMGVMLAMLVLAIGFPSLRRVLRLGRRSRQHGSEPTE